MQESDGGAVTDPPPQPLSGSLITTVVALAKKYSMNIVAPIRELRDGRFYNTAVVIDRSGTIVYVFVLGLILPFSSFWVAGCVKCGCGLIARAYVYLCLYACACESMHVPFGDMCTSFIQNLLMCAPVSKFARQKKSSRACRHCKCPLWSSCSGHYSKVFPVWGNTARTAGEVLHVTPSEEGVRVFDLDIGKMAVLICYDINFPELWHQAAALGADLIVWPSAMKTPDPSTYG